MKRALWKRRLPRGLGFKIFGAFWVAMTVAGVILLALEAERGERLALRARAVNGDAVAFYAVSVSKDHEDEQTWESRAFLGDLLARTGIHGWLFDAAGREVSGHDKAGLRRLRASSSLSAVGQLRERARVEPGTIFETAPGSTLAGFTLAAHTATAPSGRRYTFVAALPRSRFEPWNAAPGVQALRLLAVLATAGAVSWVLARHLARPIEALREATRRLSHGDLSARTAPASERRRDEMGGLARDFNLMAERLGGSLQEQARLVAAQKRLLGDVAHELRSPLARISVALELARDALPATEEESEPARVELDRIEREVSRLSELIARLLTLSRLESGVQPRQDTPVELRDLLRSVVSDAHYEASPAKSVVLDAPDVLQVLEGGVTVRGTPDLLRSAVENVVRNAVRHAPEGTSVEVSLSIEHVSDASSNRWDECDGCYVSPLPAPGGSDSDAGKPFAVISVRDRGPGVPGEEMREVFRPFYRAGKGRATRKGGVGLGLTIALRAVELHGGQVRACNAGGGGLLVEFRLPLGEARA